MRNRDDERLWNTTTVLQPASTAPESEACRLGLGYFEGNRAPMRYDEFRAQGLCVGSRVVEAGCKTVVGERCKQSGMR